MSVLVVVAKDDYNLLVYADADYGRQHWRRVQAMPSCAGDVCMQVVVLVKDDKPLSASSKTIGCYFWKK